MALSLCALLYADDIVIFSDTEANLQTLLNTVNKWCCQWRLKINLNKTNIVHIRKQSQNRTQFQFKIGENNIEIKETYKYLGCILSETFDFTVTATALAESAGRALGSLINKYRAADGLPFSVYAKVIIVVLSLSWIIVPAFGALKVILNVILFITELYVLILEYIVNLLTWLSGGMSVGQILTYDVNWK